MATPLSSDTEVAEFAGQLFFRLWRASHTRTADALKPLGLTPALFGLLNVLGARRGSYSAAAELRPRHRSERHGHPDRRA